MNLPPPALMMPKASEFECRGVLRTFQALDDDLVVAGYGGWKRRWYTFWPSMVKKSEERWAYVWALQMVDD